MKSSYLFFAMAMLAGMAIGQTNGKTLSFDECVQKFTPLMENGELGAKELCKPFKPAPKPEAVDVPAVENEIVICGGGNNCRITWTCADKRRILQHDEQNPPVYWCHKPQTETKF